MSNMYTEAILLTKTVVKLFEIHASRNIPASGLL